MMGYSKDKLFIFQLAFSKNIKTNAEMWSYRIIQNFVFSTYLMTLKLCWMVREDHQAFEFENHTL